MSIKRARDLLIDNKLDADDYRAIKNDAMELTTRLEAKLACSANKTVKIEQLLDSAINNIQQIDSLYIKGDVMQKRKILGSIFPEKLTIEKNTVRTTKGINRKSWGAIF